MNQLTDTQTLDVNIKYVTELDLIVIPHHVDRVNFG